jgi:hypothetical protein
MVQKYEVTMYVGDDSDMQPSPNGEYVLYSDYQKVLEALEEALKGWHVWTDHYVDPLSSTEDRIRIAQLRSQYLKGGGETKEAKDENDFGLFDPTP